MLAETASHHIPGDFNVMTRILWLKARPLRPKASR